MEQLTPSQIRERTAKALSTMDALFVKAGVSPTTFWRWEKGTAEIRPLTLEKLRRALERLEAEAQAQ